ncbi:MAG: GNAT family N-acetyltransferase [Sphingobium sp.]
MRCDIPAVQIEFTRLHQILSDEILAHMSDPRVSRHMPLLTFVWDQRRVDKFLAAKEERWQRDGLGHWAILCSGCYAGWGGFEKENDEWDFGLVLKPEYFGIGLTVTLKALAFARADERIAIVTFLLPPSRTRLGAMDRLGARFVGEVEHGGAHFLKYRLGIVKGTGSLGLRSASGR